MKIGSNESYNFASTYFYRQLISQELIILNMTLILIEDDPLLHELIPPDHLHEPNDWLCAT